MGSYRLTATHYKSGVTKLRLLAHFSPRYATCWITSLRVGTSAWRRDDDHQDGPSGPSWPAKFGNTWTNWSARPTGKGRSTAKGSSRGDRSWEFMLCQICLCALGVNLDCRECSNYEAPPGTAKQSTSVKTVWCPGIAADGSICNARLGFGDCSLCRAHVNFISGSIHSPTP